MRLNLKRLGLLSGRAARHFAKRAELTPQRIDLMLVLREHQLSQKVIAQRLCVHESVVSVMLSALVELGLVERIVPAYDRRRRIPQLTWRGQQRLALCFPETTAHGAQDVGEIIWLGCWGSYVAELGVHVDSILTSRTPTMFAQFAAWNSRYGHGLELRNELPS